MIVAWIVTARRSFHQTFPASLFLDVIWLPFINLLERLTLHIVGNSLLNFLISDLGLRKLPQSLFLLFNLFLFVNRLVFVHILLILVLLFGLLFVFFHLRDAFFGLRDKFALNDSDDGEPSSNKKLLLNESDFELNEKKRTPGHLMMSGSNKQRIQDMSDP